MQKALALMLEGLASYYRAWGRMLPWRENADPYRIWLSEIMLQQTRVEAVIPYYTRFLSVFPDIASLAAADEDLLNKCWEGLGYYSRARNLRRAAQAVMKDFKGALPASREALLSLPGIGPYTAGAIGSIAFGLPTPAIDGNVLRILARVFADARDILREETKKDWYTALAEVYPTGEKAGQVTQGFMELGQCLCIPNGTPLCHACPLAAICRAHALGKETDFPVRTPKKQRKICKMTVFLCHKQGKFAIRRRSGDGLLADLWEFPNEEGHLTEADAARSLVALGLTPTAMISLPPAKHIFTHLEWHMTGYLCDVEGESDAVCFASADEIQSRYPIASAFRAFKRRILDRAE